MKFGVDSLLSEDTGELEPVDFEALLGRSKDGEWVVEVEKKKEKVRAMGVEFVIWVFPK